VMTMSSCCSSQRTLILVHPDSTAPCISERTASAAIWKGMHAIWPTDSGHGRADGLQLPSVVQGPRARIGSLWNLTMGSCLGGSALSNADPKPGGVVDARRGLLLLQVKTSVFHPQAGGGRDWLRYSAILSSGSELFSFEAITEYM